MRGARRRETVSVLTLLMPKDHSGISAPNTIKKRKWKWNWNWYWYWY
jgi:hypothetical protein